MASWTLASEKEMEAQIAAGRERGRDAEATEPRAERAYYDAEAGRIVVELRDGFLIAFPPDLLDGLRGATPDQLAAVKVSPRGSVLHWPGLDADYSVPGLVAGRFGARQWMTALGRAGGRSTSTAKATAARTNGKKGGRPRKTHEPAV